MPRYNGIRDIGAKVLLELEDQIWDIVCVCVCSGHDLIRVNLIGNIRRRPLINCAPTRETDLTKLTQIEKASDTSIDKWFG